MQRSRFLLYSIICVVFTTAVLRSPTPASGETATDYLEMIERGHVSLVVYRALMSCLPSYLDLIAESTSFDREAALYSALLSIESHDVHAGAGDPKAKANLERILGALKSAHDEQRDGSDDISTIGMRARMYRAVCTVLAGKSRMLARGAWYQAMTDIDTCENRTENRSLALYLCQRFFNCAAISSTLRSTWEKQLRDRLANSATSLTTKNYIRHNLGAKAYYERKLPVALHYLNGIGGDGHVLRAAQGAQARSFWNPAIFRIQGEALLQTGAAGLLDCIEKRAEVQTRDFEERPSVCDGLLPVELDEAKVAPSLKAVLRYVAGEALFDRSNWSAAAAVFERLSPQMLTSSLWRRASLYTKTCRSLTSGSVPDQTSWAGEWEQAQSERDWQTMALVALLRARFGSRLLPTADADAVLRTCGWREDALIDARMSLRTSARAVASALLLSAMRFGDRGPTSRTECLERCVKLFDATYDIGKAWKCDPVHPPVFLAVYGAALAEMRQYEKAYGEIYYELVACRALASGAALQEIWRRLDASRRKAQSGPPSVAADHERQ